MFVIRKGELQAPRLIDDRKITKEEVLEKSKDQDIESEENLCAKGSTQDLICNPLAGDSKNPSKDYDVPSVPKSRLGLIAQLYEGENNWQNVEIYFKQGYKHQEYIYFSNFNIPSRDFQQGFGFGEEDFLKNRHGEKLIEWFAIFAKGNIVLPENESDGLYHIATISDDGVSVKIDGKMIIDSPNAHAPWIDCSDHFVEFKSKEEKSFELKYFQGSRTRIALMTFIKKVDDPSKFKKSKVCSSSYGPEELIKDGYKVISPSWFTLPAGF